MKKILKSSFIIMLIFFISTVTLEVYATISGNITLIPNKEEYNKGDEIVVDVKLSNFQSEKGINVIGAVLEYDKTNLEYVSMTGKNGWTVQNYNQANGKFLASNNSLSEEEGIVFQITFKAKTDKASNVNINLKNIEVADGTEMTNFDSASVGIEIVEKVVEPDKPDNPENPNKPDDSDTNKDSEDSNKDDNNKEDNKDNDKTDNNDENNNNNSNDKDDNSNNKDENDNNNNNENKNDNNNNNKNEDQNNANNNNGNASDNVGNKDNSNSGNNANNATPTEEDNVSKNVLPNAGNRQLILVLTIIVLIISAKVFYHKFDILNKQMGESKSKRK